MTDDGPLRAELLPSSRGLTDKDWIDDGSLSLFYLRVREVAQRGPLPVLHLSAPFCLPSISASLPDYRGVGTFLSQS